MAAAEANGLERRAYLTYLFVQLPCANTPEAKQALLPMKLNPEDLIIDGQSLKFAGRLRCDERLRHAALTPDERAI